MASTPNSTSNPKRKPVIKLETIINSEDLSVETVAAAIDSSRSFGELCKDLRELGCRLNIPDEDPSVINFTVRMTVGLLTGKQALRDILKAWCANTTGEATVSNLADVLEKMKQMQVREDMLKIITSAEKSTDAVDKSAQGYKSGRRSPGSGEGGVGGSSTFKQTRTGDTVVRQLNN